MIKVTPDESVNKNEFERHYALNPVFWDAAFDFLEKTDLDSIKPGKYDIIGKDVYASVEEYISKDEDKSRYEAHRRYADIQYVISGSEKIGVVPLSSTEENVPYNEVKDICFLKSEHDSYFNASPKNFFVFFPEDAHRPGVKIQEKIPVHKIVIKIKVN